MKKTAPISKVQKYALVRGPSRSSIPNIINLTFSDDIIDKIKDVIDTENNIDEIIDSQIDAKIIKSILRELKIAKSYLISNEHGISEVLSKSLSTLIEVLSLDIEKLLIDLSDYYLYTLLKNDFKKVDDISECIKFLTCLNKIHGNDEEYYLSFINADIVINKQVKQLLFKDPPENQIKNELHVNLTNIIYVSIAKSIIDTNYDQIIQKANDINEIEDEVEYTNDTIVSSKPSTFISLEKILYMFPEYVKQIVLEIIKYDPNDLDLLKAIELLDKYLNEKFNHLTNDFPTSDILLLSEFINISSINLRDGVSNIDEIINELLPLTRNSRIRNSQNSQIKPIGIADLKVVENRLQKYEFGELAHVENVLAGEKRGREHISLDRIEQQFIYEEEEVKSIEKDLQSTQRAELSTELEAIQNEEKTISAGITISAKYGAISIKAKSGFQNSNTSQEQARSARKLVRETIQKASERLSRRTRKEKTITTLFETKETNSHSFQAKDNNIIGQYRWIEKHYWAQVLNYGARLMFSFHIPEPASQYLWAFNNKPSGNGTLRPPDEPTFNVNDIDERNYFALAKRYEAIVTTPPDKRRIMNVQNIKGDDNEISIQIPDGYECSFIETSAVWLTSQANSSIGIVVGNKKTWINSSDPTPRFHYSSLRGEFKVKTIGYRISGESNYIVGLALYLVRTNESFASWKHSVYNSIIQAYQEKLSDYERKIASIEARKGKHITSKTDNEYREIEKTELKRGCIELLTDDKFSGFNSVKQRPGFRPVFDNSDAIDEGKIVSFIENSFEWNQITYEFHPYFWGRASTWNQKITNTNNDPIFSLFLRAGFASVVVPVERQKERDVLYYLETGNIWDGENTPIIEDEYYLALLAEIDNIETIQQNNNGIPEGRPWKQIIPTNLVSLNDDSVELPSWEFTVRQNPIHFLPSINTCRGMSYNLLEWPDDMENVLVALKKLGYEIPDSDGQSALEYFSTNAGKRVVRSFQIRANSIDISIETGSRLQIDGVIGPCTLRTLSIAINLLENNEWPGAF